MNLPENAFKRALTDRRRVDAESSRDVLLARARECEAQRRQLPNIVAVDFYADGDLLDVVATLNGVAPP